MTHFIIAVIAIALQAVSLYALLNFTPYWVKTAPDIARVIGTGISTFETAYYRYGAANAGIMPVPTLAADGGLSQFRSPIRYHAFLPQAPEGFAWKYGQNGDHYVCLYPKSGAASMHMDVYKAVIRLKRLLPAEQLVIHEGDELSCGTAAGLASEPATFPANLSVTYFLRYLPHQKPASSVLPCVENECLSSKTL